MPDRYFTQNRIKSLISTKRKELGMTQQKFAEYLTQITGKRITYGAVQGWESPKDNASFPSLENSKALATLMGVSLDEFYAYLTGEENELKRDDLEINKVKSFCIQTDLQDQIALYEILHREILNRLHNQQVSDN